MLAYIIILSIIAYLVMGFFVSAIYTVLAEEPFESNNNSAVFSIWPIVIIFGTIFYIIKFSYLGLKKIHLIALICNIARILNPIGWWWKFTIKLNPDVINKRRRWNKRKQESHVVYDRSYKINDKLFEEKAAQFLNES